MSHWKQHYDTQGYHFPLTACTVDQAHELRRQLESAEDRVAQDPSLQTLLNSQPATVLTFADRIARMPSIVEPVCEILGQDVLLWNASLFIKEPRSPSYISWHQDLKYWGMDDSHEVTAWLALSTVTTATGCMKFIPGSHTQDMVEHIDTFSENNLLSRGQELAVDVNEADAVHVELQPGEFSLHHGKLFHGSSPNTTDDRRIGLALRYISTHMRQREDLKPFAKLVSGEDRFGHFQLLDTPQGDLREEDIAIAHENIRIQEQFLFDGAGNKPG